VTSEIHSSTPEPKQEARSNRGYCELIFERQSEGYYKFKHQLVRSLTKNDDESPKLRRFEGTDGVCTLSTTTGLSIQSNCNITGLEKVKTLTSLE
jgi:hypothetical protein